MSHLSSVVTTFNERANEYQKSEWHQRYAKRLVEVTPVKPGDRVLDAGIGTGFAAFAILQRVGPTGYVVGVDIAPGMLQEARTIVETKGLQNIEILEADATDLSQFSPSTFDVIICAAAILYMPVMKALTEWYRLLKPGCVATVSTMKTGSPKAGQLFRDCSKRFGVVLRDPSEELGSVESCRQALAFSGFTSVEVIEEQIEFSRSDLAQAWESNFRSAKHYAVRQLSASAQQALRQDYELALTRAETQDADALYRADVLYAIGRK